MKSSPKAWMEQSGISSDDDPVAQPAEQLPFKQWVRGSNPRRVTKKILRAAMAPRIFFLLFMLFMLENQG